jgi:hypothetical protein
MDQDVRTLSGKPACYEPAHTIGRAGDQHGFRFKVHIPADGAPAVPWID